MTFAPSNTPNPDEDRYDDCFLPSQPPRRNPGVYTLSANAQAMPAPGGFRTADSEIFGPQEPEEFQRPLRSTPHRSPSTHSGFEPKRAYERRNQFQEERRDLMDRLARSIVDCEEGANQAARQADAMHQAAESFRRHLAVIETIHPEDWADEELHLELSRAQSIVDEAQEDYDSALRHIDGLEPQSRSRFSVPKSKKGESFADALRTGFAFWLPLLVLGTVATILIVTAMGK